MKVFIVTSEAFPNGMASTKRILNYAKALRDVNVPCEVLTFSRYRHGNEHIKGTVFDGIPYKYFTNKGTKNTEKNLSYKVEPIFIRYKLLHFLRAHLSKGDIVLGYLKEICMTKSIIYITHRKGAKYVQELCELPAVTIKDSKRAKKEREKIEQHLFPKFDGILAISQALSEYAGLHISSHCLIQIIPILVDFEEYRLDDQSCKSDVPYVFHSGTLSEKKDGFLGMLKAFGIAVKEMKLDAFFISTGSLSNIVNKKEVNEILREYEIEERVRFTGFLSDEMLKQYLSEASLVIINKGINLQNKYCFSTKLGEYMAAGKPIVITRVGEAMNWLTDGLNAYIVEPDDVRGMALAITRAFNNESERKLIGENARVLCKDSFQYNHYGYILKDFFSKL